MSCDGCSDSYCGDCAAREATAAAVELRRVSGLPAVRVHHPHVDVRADLLAGSPVVSGSKVPVRRIWEWHRRGVTVETLVKRYPQLGPPKILDALSFAYDHQDIMEADLARERALLNAQDVDGIPGNMDQLPLPISDQGNLHSSTGHAAANALNVARDTREIGGGRLAAYYHERPKEKP